MTKLDVSELRAWSKLNQASRDIVHTIPAKLNQPALDSYLNSAQVGKLLVDWSHQRINDEVAARLFELAEELDVYDRFATQLAGGIANPSESRPVLHTSLRSKDSSVATSTSIAVTEGQKEFIDFANAVQEKTVRGSNGKPFTDVLHIGIGGSHLGPKLLCEALQVTSPRVHFLSNIDPINVKDTLAPLDPSRTLIITVSKSFSTPETLRNFEAVRAWFSQQLPVNVMHDHFVYVTSNTGVEKTLLGRSFSLDESIGGRFSIWSAVGLPVAIALGAHKFKSFLSGARQLDELTRTAKTHENPALMLALMTLWNTNFLGTSSHLLLTYEHRLRGFTPFVQQLEMESLGKSIRINGERSTLHTLPTIWGGEETNGQHAWHQWLHQGTRAFSADFLVTAPAHRADESRNWILANCLAQREVFLRGHDPRDGNAYKEIKGGHGSNLIVFDDVDPESLGTLIALYEHKVSFLGMLWGINAFDQWGVEHGKRVAEDVYARLQSEGDSKSSDSISHFIKWLRSKQSH